MNLQKNRVYYEDMEAWKFWTIDYQEELKAGVQNCYWKSTDNI